MADLLRLTVSKIEGFGSVEKGARLGIQLVDHNGISLLLEIPHQMAAQFLLALHSADGHASEDRGELSNPAIMNALAVQNILFAPADNGALGVRIELPAGIKLDLALTANQALEFRKSLDEIEQNYRLGGSSLSQ